MIMIHLKIGTKTTYAGSKNEMTDNHEGGGYLLPAECGIHCAREGGLPGP